MTTLIRIQTILLAGVLATPLCVGAEAAGPMASAATLAGKVDAHSPFSLLQTASDTMMRELAAHRGDYRKNPAMIYRLVDAVLLPHFDMEYSARLVLAKHWRAATAPQRARFQNAIYRSMLTNYGDAIADFRADQLKVLPLTIAADAMVATVRSEVKRSNGEKVPVNYSLRRTPAGWKVWDVTIEGISYVKSFREDFGSEIDRRGLEPVIQRLETDANLAK